MFEAVLYVAWIAYGIAVYAGVLLDRRGRGLHDRAAGTVVLAENRA